MAVPDEVAAAIRACVVRKNYADTVTRCDSTLASQECGHTVHPGNTIFFEKEIPPLSVSAPAQAAHGTKARPAK